MEQEPPLTDQRFRLAALLVIAAITIALFCLGQNAAAVVSVLTQVGLVVNTLWSPSRKRPRREPQETSADKTW